MTKTKTKRRKWASRSRYKPNPKWHYGKESELLLCVKVFGHFLPNFASLDVRSKFSTGSNNEYPTARKIELLKKLFEKGGTRGNAFHPAHVEFAAICPNESGSGMADIRKSIEIWTPASGWHVYQPKIPKFGEWRVWLAGLPKNITISFEELAAEHSGFCAKFWAEKSHIIERYADPETGDIQPEFLIAAHLGDAASIRAKCGTYTRCYIYHSASTTPVCRVDLGTGRLMAFKDGNGWVNPATFKNLS